MSTHKIKILFFATLKAQAGVSEAELEMPLNSTVEQFKALLLEDFPGA